jgi:tetratricopeptide (TPR) repeat protein
VKISRGPLVVSSPCASLALFALLLAGPIHAQEPSSKESSGQEPHPQQQGSSSSAAAGERAVDTTGQVARAHVVDASGAAITLETNEALFQLAAGLNTCGYDADLEHSAPVRVEVRADIQKALLASEPARASRDALCAYIAQHQLNDSGRSVGQYVSLALYLLPPPELTPSVDILELPPDSAAVVNVLPLLRTFAEATQLHAIWVLHRREYEQLTAAVRAPMVAMLQNTNIYLHQPVSSYDARRMLVLLEPLIAPTLTHARIYATDYIVVASPHGGEADAATGNVRLDLIRHIYLSYLVEPMVYSRAAAMERLQPLLRPVQDAPLEFQYKSDVTALITECLIKAIEARLYLPPGPQPVRPKGVLTRAEQMQYDAAIAAWQKVAELERRHVVETDEREGWTLTGYFFGKLQDMERNGDGLRDEMGPMLYGMDVDRERHHDEQIVFARTDARTGSVLQGGVRPARVLPPMDRAELALAKGDRDSAQAIAEKVMADPTGDHGRAAYTLGRLALTRGDAEGAQKDFEQALATSNDARTLAWSHIYLGRMYDTMHEPQRDKAIAEYQAALTVRDARPDTRAAAERGLKTPFAPPQRARPAPADDDKLDPTGKAEKESYKPDAPK